MIGRGCAIGLGALLLAGCSMVPKTVLPKAAVPPAWPTGAAYGPSDTGPVADYSWRTVFADPRLSRLIETALANNPDAAIAAANVAAARAQVQVQRAAQFPTLDATGNYNHADGPRLGAGGAANGNVVNRGASDSFSAQGGVSGYELDFFGRLAALTGAARAQYLASQSALRTAKLTLAADVANGWLTYAQDASLLAIARDTATSAREAVRITKRRLDGGIAPRTDLRQAEIVLQGAEADIARQTTLLAQDANALRVLVGADVAPADLPQSLADAGGRIAQVPAGLDSSVLLRRPDVIDAEFRLRAANARIGAARAALFPRITLTGLFGFASTALSSLFTGSQFAWSAGTNASYAVFDGGAARGGVALSAAQRDAALATYRKAVQVAFGDVANALARRGTIADEVKARTAARDAAADTLKLAILRYRGGVDSYLGELTARQTLYTAERALAAVQAEEATNRVALYRALGGDTFE